MPDRQDKRFFGFWGGEYQFEWFEVVADFKSILIFLFAEVVVEGGVVEIDRIIIDGIIFSLKFDPNLYLSAFGQGETVDGFTWGFLKVYLFLEGEKRVFEGLQLVATQLEHLLEEIILLIDKLMLQGQQLQVWQRSHTLQVC